jgi:hypothetical protein
MQRRSRFYPADAIPLSIRGLPIRQRSTSVKLPGADGLRVHLRARGLTLGEIVAVPELRWHAHGIPFYKYLLDVAARRPARRRALHSVRLPEATRMMQAVTLAAILVERDSVSLMTCRRPSPPELPAFIKWRPHGAGRSRDKNIQRLFSLPIYGRLYPVTCGHKLPELGPTPIPPVS